MTPAARSVQVFGIYLVATGAVLVFAPNLLLGLLGMPEAREVWIRVLGIVVAVLGVYYLVAAARALVDFYLPTVVLRSLVFVAFGVLAWLQLAPVQLVGFGVVDLLGALWTWRALRAGR
jgi:hypothetical protein